MRRDVGLGAVAGFARKARFVFVRWMTDWDFEDAVSTACEARVVAIAIAFGKEVSWRSRWLKIILVRHHPNADLPISIQLHSRPFPSYHSRRLTFSLVAVMFLCFHNLIASATAPATSFLAAADESSVNSCGRCRSILEPGVLNGSLFGVSASSRLLPLLPYRADGICAGSLGG